MPVQSNAEVAAAQLELVDPTIATLFERGQHFLQEIERAEDAHEVSTRLMRIVLEVNPGGEYGAYDPDDGDLGQGSGEVYDVALVGPVYRKSTFQITFLSKYATDSRKKAIIDSTNNIVAKGMKQFRADLDKELNGGPGNAVLGTINSLAGNVATMAVPSGAQLVRANMPVQIYDTTLTINRSANSGVATRVLQADPIVTQTIVFDQLPPGTVATDVVVVAGVVGANPVGLYGIKYHQNNATTGTWLNLNRAVYPVQLQTPRVNGNAGALVPMQPWLVINKIKKALGLEELGRPFWHMAVEQSHAWNQLAVTVQIIDRADRPTGEGQDMAIRGAKSSAGNMCGLRIKESQNADQTRIDLIDASVWGRAVIKNIGFMKFANGNVWFQAYGASGGPKASMGFVYDYDLQVFVRNPRKGGFVDNLARPSGF